MNHRKTFLTVGILIAMSGHGNVALGGPKELALCLCAVLTGSVVGCGGGYQRVNVSPVAVVPVDPSLKLSPEAGNPYGEAERFAQIVRESAEKATSLEDYVNRVLSAAATDPAVKQSLADLGKHLQLSRFRVPSGAAARETVIADFLESYVLAPAHSSDEATLRARVQWLDSAGLVPVLAAGPEGLFDGYTAILSGKSVSAEQMKGLAARAEATRARLLADAAGW